MEENCPLFSPGGDGDDGKPEDGLTSACCCSTTSKALALVPLLSAVTATSTRSTTHRRWGQIPFLPSTHLFP